MADLEDAGDKNKSDFMTAGGTLLTNINYKVTALLFMILVVCFSDLFVDVVLTEVPDAIVTGQVTTKGTLIQVACVTFGYVASDLLVKYGFL
jgi:hypothetical protein